MARTKELLIEIMERIVKDNEGNPHWIEKGKHTGRLCQNRKTQQFLLKKKLYQKKQTNKQKTNRSKLESIFVKKKIRNR